MNNLTLEQDLKLNIFKNQVSKMNEQQVKSLLIKGFEEMLIQDNLYKELQKKNGEYELFISERKNH